MDVQYRNRLSRISVLVSVLSGLYPAVYLGPPKPCPELVLPFCLLCTVTMKQLSSPNAGRAMRPQGIVSAAAYAGGAPGKQAGWKAEGLNWIRSTHSEYSNLRFLQPCLCLPEKKLSTFTWSAGIWDLFSAPSTKSSIHLSSSCILTF